MNKFLWTVRRSTDAVLSLLQGPMIMADAGTTTLASTTSPQSTEGSLSDSGISDSGSEQELSERERRLAALRRLARSLEAVLAPGSEALVSMAKVGALFSEPLFNLIRRSNTIWSEFSRQG
jgi:hypothetical protein